jgi:hypothetical protein
VTAFTLWKAGDVSVTKGADTIGRFNKMGMSDRQFCTKCGGHIMPGHPTIGFTDVYASVIPDLAFQPVVHLHYAETVLPIRDGPSKEISCRGGRIRRVDAGIASAEV